jgi:hypothetical protein
VVIKPPRIVLATLVWVLSVIGVASIAWVAVDSAGSQVGGGPVWTTRDSQEPAGQSDASASPTTRPGGSMLGTAAPLPAGSPSVKPSPSASPRRSSSPSTTRLTEQAPSPGSSSPSRVKVPAGADRSTGVTLALSGGQMTIFCSDDDVKDWRLVPALGWAVFGQLSSSGPVRLKATFFRGDTRIVVRVHCENGRPVFEKASE